MKELNELRMIIRFSCGCIKHSEALQLIDKIEEKIEEYQESF